MSNRKKFIQYLEESQYCKIEKTETTEKGKVKIGVSFTENSGYEITQFVCEKANNYGFDVFAVIWDGAIIFIEQKQTIRSKIGI